MFVILYFLLNFLLCFLFFIFNSFLKKQKTIYKIKLIKKHNLSYFYIFSNCNFKIFVYILFNDRNNNHKIFYFSSLILFHNIKILWFVKFINKKYFLILKNIFQIKINI